jgi:hypothetical protein
VVIDPHVLTLEAGESEFITATVYDGSHATPLLRPTWASGDSAVGYVDEAGRVVAQGAGVVLLTAQHASAVDTLQLTVRVTRTVPSLFGRWRMTMMGTQQLPAVYRTFHDEPVDGRVVALVEIRIDSATATIDASGGYRRRYYLSEWHDGVRRYRYQWGDHGRTALRLGTEDGPAAVRFLSEYIQYLSTSGAATDGVLHLTESLWTGEAPELTQWVRVGQP